MSFGRIVKVTSATPNGPVEVVYIVAEAGVANAIQIVKDRVAKPDDVIEVVGRASEQLIKTLELAPGMLFKS